MAHRRAKTWKGRLDKVMAKTEYPTWSVNWEVGRVGRIKIGYKDSKKTLDLTLLKWLYDPKRGAGFEISSIEATDEGWEMFFYDFGKWETFNEREEPVDAVELASYRVEDACGILELSDKKRFGGTIDALKAAIHDARDVGKKAGGKMHEEP
ncbi:MAG: hypothetical protein MPJ06_02555 [Nitrosopumilus sp.]|nr:hypothetical protein [Nitrosopumilus sp.]MDA7942879.1 hypothetical protein [Nitrosopumilus sp.]MDA7998767.1 hypothetical protein [Nitrosopumilus sp.]